MGGRVGGRGVRIMTKSRTTYINKDHGDDARIIK
jgi:hypothetical protein